MPVRRRAPTEAMSSGVIQGREWGITTSSRVESREPLLEIEQRPDEEATVAGALEVFAHQRTDRLSIHQCVDPRLRVEQAASDEIDAVALEPARIWGGESLFLGPSDGLGQVPSHNVPQDLLAITRAAVERRLLVARLVLIESHDLGEIIELEPHGAAGCEVDQIIVEKWNP